MFMTIYTVHFGVGQIAAVAYRTVELESVKTESTLDNAKWRRPSGVDVLECVS